MTEIKERVAVIDSVVNDSAKLPLRYGHELCHLQLRLICELIALGCIAAHGNVPATYSKRLRQTYEPGRIFSEMEKLHPAFYPRICEKKVQAHNNTLSVRLADDKDALSKAEIIALHGKTGNVLHRGNLQDIGKTIVLDFPDIARWKNKIVDLLTLHWISLVDEERHILVMMSEPGTGVVSTREITTTHASQGWVVDQGRRRSRTR